MPTRAATLPALALLLSLGAAGCGGADAALDGSADDLRGQRRCRTDADCPQGQLCASRVCRPAPVTPPPDLPPPSCDQRSPGRTAIRAKVRVAAYAGLQRGHSGSHEIAYGSLLATEWVFAPATLDTTNVELAMNVASSIDPTGLPQEVPLHPGDLVELQGEYISLAGGASAHDAQGPAAVLHFTHAPCGWVVINGQRYQ